MDAKKTRINAWQYLLIAKTNYQDPQKWRKHNEIFHLDLTKTNTVDGQLMIVVREKALPLFFLNEMLSSHFGGVERDRQGHVVLAQIGTQTVGFVVDSLVGQEEVVIKPLGKSLHGTPGMAGATITSDGKIALILDIPSLLKHYVG